MVVVVLEMVKVVMVIDSQIDTYIHTYILDAYMIDGWIDR